MTKEKFTEGQLVVVLGPPKGWDDGILYWNDTMAKYIGKSFTIKEVMSRDTRVRLNMGEDTYLWMWHIDWISPVAEYTLF